MDRISGVGFGFPIDRMTRPRTVLGVLAAMLALATSPALAPAEDALIPPGNSAVNQYTESFPTSRGNKETAKRSERSPKQVLGSKNAKRLESHGSDGREVAEVAAETAPVATEGSGGQEQAGGEAESATGDEGSEGGVTGGGGGGTDDAGPAGGGTASDPTPAHVDRAVADPEGSSGLSEVLAQATGSADSGETGLLLPLVIVLALAGSVAYALRQRKVAGR